MLNNDIQKLVKKIDESIIDDEVKVWLISQLNTNDNGSFLIKYLYFEKNQSKFNTNTLNEIKRYFNGVSRSEAVKDPSKIFVKEPIVILNTIESGISINELKDQISNFKSQLTIVLTDNPAEIKLDKVIFYNETDFRSLTSLITKCKLDKEIEGFKKFKEGKKKSKFEIISNRLDLYKTEVKSKLYETEQSSIITKDDDRGKSAEVLKKLKAKIKKHEGIFKNNLAEELKVKFGILSKSQSKLQSDLEKTVDLKENSKQKKILLSLEDDFVQELNTEISSNATQFWQENIWNIESYFSRTKDFTIKALEELNLNQEIASKQLVDTDTINEILSKSEVNDFRSLTSEMTRKRIGDYLMRARMFPMYILMGSSMLGISIARGGNAKYIAPFMIFVMGLGFFMIYKSRQKEEADEKEKALITIKDKASNEIKKRYDSVNSGIKNFSESKVKANNEYLLNLFEQIVSLGDNKSKRRDVTSRSSSVGRKFEKLLDAIEKIETNLDSLKPSIK